MNVNIEHERQKAEFTKINFTELTTTLNKCKKIIEAEEGIRTDLSFLEMVIIPTL